jgi:hypothetical protein
MTSLPAQLPPHDKEAEKAVLGSLLVDVEALPDRTYDGLLRTLMTVDKPTDCGYESRFVALCYRWPDVALPVAISRDLTRADFCYGASTELYSWALARWQGNEPTPYGFISTFFHERTQAREEVDALRQHWRTWCHLGDSWYPDQWHPTAAEYWPDLTATLAELLIDKMLAAGFGRRFYFVAKRLERTLAASDDPRKGVASLLREYRAAARRARPRAKLLLPPSAVADARVPV